jgi:hypothetical protein
MNSESVENCGCMFVRTTCVCVIYVSMDSKDRNLMEIIPIYYGFCRSKSRILLYKSQMNFKVCHNWLHWVNYVLKLGEH